MLHSDYCTVGPSGESKLSVDATVRRTEIAWVPFPQYGSWLYEPIIRTLASRLLLLCHVHAQVDRRSNHQTYDNRMVPGGQAFSRI